MNRLLTFVLLIAANASTILGAPLPGSSQLDSRATAESSLNSMEGKPATSTKTYGHQPPPPPPIDYYARNLKTLNSIYNLTIWPYNSKLITNGTYNVPDHLFANNTKGRVSPLGNFTDYAESVEYFFGLAPVPMESSTGAVFTKAEIVHFSSSCAEVASSVVYFTASTVGGKFITKLKQMGFWKFDKETGAVLEYDLTVTGLQDFTSAILDGANLENRQVQLSQINQLCGGIQLQCYGKNQQYKDFGDCVAQLSAKPFGTYYQAWSDSVVCRTVHVILTFYRPDIHCPHVGPKGGMKCVDYPYVQRDFGDEGLFGEGESTFICPDRIPKPTPITNTTQPAEPTQPPTKVPRGCA